MLEVSSCDGTTHTISIDINEDGIDVATPPSVPLFVPPYHDLDNVDGSPGNAQFSLADLKP